MKIEDIKRYRLFVVDDGDGFPYLDDKEDLHGEYVKYSDHKQIVDLMHNLLTEMCEALILQTDKYCQCCGTCADENGSIKHKDYCDVLQAQQYLQDTKEKS